MTPTDKAVREALERCGQAFDSLRNWERFDRTEAMDDEYFDGVTTLDAAAISTIESALACQSVPSDDVRQAVKVLVDRACHMCHGSHEGCNLKCDAGSAVRTILGDGVKP